MYGSGPRRARQQQDRRFRQQVGYNRDPAWQLPALQLLPTDTGVIDAHGAVAWDGLHFADELLTLFPHTDVTLRLSQHSEATAWVYIDGAIVCEAKARELRRADATYRTRRPPGQSRLIEEEQ